MTAHTPGPWIVGQDTYDMRRRMIYTTDGTDVTPVAFTGRDNADADARLIAAAPALLAALRGLLGAAGLNEDALEEYDRDLIGDARAALALADGTPTSPRECGPEGIDLAADAEDRP